MNPPANEPTSRAKVLRHGTHEFEIPSFDLGGFYSILFAGTYDRFSMRLSSEDIVLDGGANIGVYSITLSPNVKHVFAVEPDPTNYSYLVRNLERNRVPNVTPVNAALASKEGTGFLLGSGEIGFLADHGIPVKLVTIDSVTGGGVTAIKLDIEGAECLALRGQASLDSVHSIVYERDPTHMDWMQLTRAFGGDPENSYEYLDSYLESRGFKVEEIGLAPLSIVRRVLTWSAVSAELRSGFFASRFLLSQFPFTSPSLLTPRGFPPVTTMLASRLTRPA